MNLEDRQASIRHVMQFFACDHLPLPLRMVSHQCYDLAVIMTETLPDSLPDSLELTEGLRKLLEAKDCFSFVQP